MDVADWLRTLGLERYEAAFRQNDVGAELLPDVTAEDLKDLGITSVGHRRRLLEAIATLRSNSRAAGDTVQRAQGPARNPRSTESPAERRPLTVVFCDLVDSTELAARLDPENLRDIIGAYHKAIALVLTRFGGFVAKYMGDGVLAYFGYPQAHEDDAERAVRAGLALVDAVAQLDLGERLQLRIGVATGLVVVGDLLGSGAAQEQAVVGETPNLAARLQALAEPNTVVIADSTRRQVGSLFELHDLGPQILKGFASEQRVWRVIRDSGAASRFEALRGSKMTPLIGRQEELELLLRRWRQARTGQGRTVMVSGEPGIGKSRLLAALEAELRDEPHTRMRYFCSPHQQDSPLHPVIRQIEFAAGFARDDTPADRVDKLRRLLAPTDPTPEDVALLAALLLLPTDGLSMPNLSPRRRKERTFEALIRQVKQLSGERPILMLFEDVHWTDPSTRDILDILIQHLDTLRVLVVMTFRPEFLAPWTGHAGVALITLGRLDRIDTTSIAMQMAIGPVLPHELLERIVAQSDGVPLFVEELTKAVMATATQAALEASPIAAPATLQASLLARLDRMPIAKQIAQIGAVIGRDFSHTLVAGVAQVPDAQLAHGLDELVGSGLAFRRGLGPDAEYTFKHALVQDAAYESLLRSRRAEIHASIVALAESDRFSGSIEPGILAHHCAQGGMIAKAASYYRVAGERSAERLVAAETKGHLYRGLQIAERLPLGPDRYRLEAELLIALGRILLPTLGQTHPETSNVLERAVAICRKFDDPAMLARSLYALGIVAEVPGDLRNAQVIGEEFLALAESTGDTSIAIASRVRLGAALLYQGHFAIARDNLSDALVLCAQGTHVLLDVAVSFTPEVSSLTYLAPTLAYLGYADQAATRAEQAVLRAQQLGPIPLAFAMHHSIRASLALRDDAWCRNAGEMQMAIAEEQGLPPFLANARCALGWLTAKQGNVLQGLNMLTEGIASLTSLGQKNLTSLVNGLMSDALAWSGRQSDAVAALDEALAVSACTRAGWLDAELYRRKAELFITGSNQDAAEAEGQFQKAIDVARSQSARLFELRAGIGLARLWCRHGRRAEAHALLAPIYAWFTEGFSTPDLTDARALLDELAAARA
jgi:class 3 adenylate cyclase/predicted ATPase